MKCPKCCECYPANLGVSCSPGGQESPGLFLVITGVFVIIAIAFFVFDQSLYAAFSGFIALFVAVQVLVAWGDCKSATRCPNCKEKAPVKPWSF